MPIMINGVNWNFPNYSLNEDEAFGNIRILKAEAYLLGISLDKDEMFFDEIQKRENFYMGKYYSHIANNYEPGCFITLELPQPRQYYYSESQNGKFLIDPVLLSRVKNEVISSGRFRPDQDEGKVKEEINRFMDQNASQDKIWLDGYVNKTFRQSVGSLMESFSLRGAINNVVNKYNEQKKKLEDQVDEVKNFDPFKGIND